MGSTFIKYSAQVETPKKHMQSPTQSPTTSTDPTWINSIPSSSNTEIDTIRPQTALHFVWDDNACETFTTKAVELASSIPQPSFLSPGTPMTLSTLKSNIVDICAKKCGGGRINNNLIVLGASLDQLVTVAECLRDVEHSTFFQMGASGFEKDTVLATVFLVMDSGGEPHRNVRVAWNRGVPTQGRRVFK